MWWTLLLLAAHVQRCSLVPSVFVGDHEVHFAHPVPVNSSAHLNGTKDPDRAEKFLIEIVSGNSTELEDYDEDYEDYEEDFAEDDRRQFNVTLPDGQVVNVFAGARSVTLYFPKSHGPKDTEVQPVVLEYDDEFLEDVEDEETEEMSGRTFGDCIVVEGSGPTFSHLARSYDKPEDKGPERDHWDNFGDTLAEIISKLRRIEDDVKARQKDKKPPYPRPVYTRPVQEERPQFGPQPYPDIPVLDSNDYDPEGEEDSKGKAGYGHYYVKYYTTRPGTSMTTVGNETVYSTSTTEEVNVTETVTQHSGNLTSSTEEPVNMTTSSGSSTEEPGNVTTQSGSTEEPGNVTTPSGSSEGPGNVTTATSTEEPGNGTTPSGSSTEEPGNVTTSGSTEEPGNVTTPSASTEEPGNLTTPSGSSTEESGNVTTPASTEEPENGTTPSGSSTEEPGNVTTSGSTEEPGNLTTPSGSSTEGSGNVTTPASTEEPENGTTPSGSSTEEPGNVTAPSASTEEPANLTTPSGSSTVEPGNVTTPSGSTEEPGNLTTPSGSSPVEPGDVTIPSGSSTMAPSNLTIPSSEEPANLTIPFGSSTEETGNLTTPSSEQLGNLTTSSSGQPAQPVNLTVTTAGPLASTSSPEPVVDFSEFIRLAPGIQTSTTVTTTTPRAVKSLARAGDVFEERISTVKWDHDATTRHFTTHSSNFTEFVNLIVSNTSFPTNSTHARRAGVKEDISGYLLLEDGENWDVSIKDSTTHIPLPSTPFTEQFLNLSSEAVTLTTILFEQNASSGLPTFLANITSDVNATDSPGINGTDHLNTTMERASVLHKILAAIFGDGHSANTTLAFVNTTGYTTSLPSLVNETTMDTSYTYNSSSFFNRTTLDYLVDETSTEIVVNWTSSPLHNGTSSQKPIAVEDHLGANRTNSTMVTPDRTSTSRGSTWMSSEPSVTSDVTESTISSNLTGPTISSNITGSTTSSNLAGSIIALNATEATLVSNMTEVLENGTSFKRSFDKETLFNGSYSTMGTADRNSTSGYPEGHLRSFAGHVPILISEVTSPNSTESTFPRNSTESTLPPNSTESTLSPNSTEAESISNITTAYTATSFKRSFDNTDPLPLLSNYTPPSNETIPPAELARYAIHGPSLVNVTQGHSKVTSVTWLQNAQENATSPLPGSTVDASTGPSYGICPYPVRDKRGRNETLLLLQHLVDTKTIFSENAIDLLARIDLESLVQIGTSTTFSWTSLSSTAEAVTSTSATTTTTEATTLMAPLARARHYGGFPLEDQKGSVNTTAEPTATSSEIEVDTSPKLIEEDLISNSELHVPKRHVQEFAVSSTTAECNSTGDCVEDLNERCVSGRCGCGKGFSRRSSSGICLLKASDFEVAMSPVIGKPGNLKGHVAKGPCDDHNLNHCSVNAFCHPEPHHEDTLTVPYVCVCKEGFKDESPNVLYPGEICIGVCHDGACNGRGVCSIDKDGNANCMCDTWFMGHRCEMDGLAILFGVIGGFGIVVIICLGSFCIYHRLVHSRRWVSLV